MDVASTAAQALTAQTAQVRSEMLTGAMRQQQQAQQQIADVLAQETQQAAPSSDPNRGQNVNLLV